MSTQNSFATSSTFADSSNILFCFSMFPENYSKIRQKGRFLENLTLLMAQRVDMKAEKSRTERMSVRDHLHVYPLSH